LNRWFGGTADKTLRSWGQFMRIFINRNKFFLIGIVIILFFVFLNKIWFLINSESATGHLKRMESSGWGIQVPIIEFSAKGYDVEFSATDNMTIEDTHNIKVIYNPDNLTDARVFTFQGFWLTGLIYSIIPLIILAASVFSFIEKDELFVFNLREFKVSRVSDNQDWGEDEEVKLRKIMNELNGKSS
jgi:hypothetical protein